MSNDNIAIRVENVSKDFMLPHKERRTLKSFFLNPFSKATNEKQHALSDISFNVKKGEFFGIVGRNGSGKSTLLKCIAGVYTPNKGKIQLNGSLVPFIELGVGFNPELSGRDNIYLNGSLLGFSRKEINEMYDEIIEFSELEKFVDQKLKNYSSGMQVRLAFSIAIRSKGDILLLDEVLAVGDSAFQRKCMRYFEDIKDSGTTIVLVTHDMNAVKRFCSRAILVESGNITKKGRALEVADEYANINIVNASDAGSPKNRDRNETVEINILEQAEKKLIFKMSHKEDNNNKYFFGFSLIKEGITFAELNNYKSKKGEIKDKSLTYELSIEKLNPGVYEISATLFNERTKGPVAYTRKRPQFIIKGSDISHGGAIRLEDSWIN